MYNETTGLVYSPVIFLDHELGRNENIQGY